MSFAITTALIVLITAVGLTKIPRYQWPVAGLLLLVITPIALPGFWPNGQWGISDWDYYFSYHAAIEKIVKQHTILPQWNPYICGGTSAIGDPEFPLFAPTFWLELLFGVPLGLRLGIFAITAFGGVGMLLLAKRLRLPPTAGLLATLAFCFGSINLLEIVEGHPNVFSAYYLPWIFWAWLSAYGVNSKFKIQNSKFWILLCGIFLALTFFQGGIYMLMYISMAFLFLVAALPERLKAFRISFTAGLWALGLAAIKVVPVLLWLQQFQDKAYASSTYLLPSLHKILLGRYPHGSENIISNQGSGWHEYGAYLGFIVLICVLASLRRWRDRRVQLLWAGAIIATLIAASGPLLKPLFDQANWLPRSNISRLMILAILPLSLLAGFGMQAVARKGRLAAIFAAIIISAAAFELTSYAGALSQQAFILNPPPSQSPALPPIAYTIGQNVVRVNEIDYTRAYAGIKAGYGTLSYCSVLGPQPSVRVIEDPEGSPYLEVSPNKGHAELISWSPQALVVKATITEPADLTINSNYAPGWEVAELIADAPPATRPAHDIAGRLATRLEPGRHILRFTYRAAGLKAGSVISLFTLLAAAFLLSLSLYNKVRQRRT